ncbi:MAG TPA: efflux RND transporter periplasmic adaptor subunit [Candidatus Binataceae bacterium]|nr:efflux RND transporter periplasmic adaptor subunit [Candidatus Binataceae bacterium]
MPSWVTSRRFLIAVGIAALAAFYLIFLRGGAPAVTYLTAKVTRGSIVRAVVATGTVNPVTTVQVGSYVSGPIQAIYADFNSPVKAGQLIAKIDPRPFEVKVAQSTATLANARAQLDKDSADMAYKKITAERDRQLRAANVVSQDTVDSAHSAYLQAQAQVALDRANIQQQQAMLHEAQVNLGYTNIVSPVDGTVVSRNVDVGQTVASSFQTPTLFLIARDLTQMQVDTNVSESDIGNVRSGERAEFHVDAFPDRPFIGSVGQVRQAPITVQNVVTYDVVVNVANPELLLKPGMTADVTIITARRDDVLRLPVEALRFAPKIDGATAPTASAPPIADTTRARVFIQRGGTLEAVPLKTGLSDGTWVEVLSGNLALGQKVVTDEIRADATQLSPPHFPH